MKRDYDVEHKDNESRQYQYQVDLLVRKMFLSRIQKHIKERSFGKVLEVGSYDGSMTELILEHVDHMEVIEPSLELTKKVSAKFGNRVTISNTTLEQFNPQIKYSLVFLIHTLEHIDDSLGALMKLRELLDKDGLLIVMVPNAEALSRQIAVEMGLMSSIYDVLESEKSQGHIRNYDMQSLSSEIREAGMHCLESGGVLLKTLANFQFDRALEAGIISLEYLDACNNLALRFPSLCSSIYALAENRKTK